MEERLDHPKLRKIDAVVEKVIRFLSYVTPYLLLYMAFSAVVDVVVAKVFKHSLNNVNAIIEYLLIAVIYLGAPFIQITSGLVRVDIIYGRFPQKVKRILNLVFYAIGTVLYGIAGYVGIDNLMNLYEKKTLASGSITSFQVWPFALIYVIGTFLLTITFAWSVVRLICIPDKVIHEQKAPPSADEDNPEGKEAPAV